MRLDRVGFVVVCEVFVRSIWSSTADGAAIGGSAATATAPFDDAAM